MNLNKLVRTIDIINVDTKEKDLVIEEWTSNENNIYGYVCCDTKENVIGTKYFMEHVTIREVTASFRKLIREKKYALAA